MMASQKGHAILKLRNQINFSAQNFDGFGKFVKI